jgi:hypothetical protein
MNYRQISLLFKKPWLPIQRGKRGVGFQLKSPKSDGILFFLKLFGGDF